MDRIGNFPEYLLVEHDRRHRRNRNMGQLRSGDGLEFLSFHRNYLQKALEWYNSQGLNQRSVAAWSSIPSEITRHPGWTRALQNAENQIMRNLSSFNSADELGRFLQTTSLHNAVHVIGSEVYNDTDFARISLSPRSTLFYNWHGLIDNWWRQLENQVIGD
ncbi:MAG TPA: hypothetical protein VEY70_20305 [Metabacillus sp.]|nr:hypothetical protein [Metabacillus sp.]